jgi:hypothetical protein
MVIGLLTDALSGLPSYGWQSVIGGVVGGVCRPATGLPGPLIEADVVVDTLDNKSSVMSESAGDGDFESANGDADERWEAGKLRTDKPRASWEKVDGAEARFAGMFDDEAV